jgi:hypothetical protein
MKFSQLGQSTLGCPNQLVLLVNFQSTLVNPAFKSLINLNTSVVDQILKVSQLTIELTYPPLGGSQLVNFCRSLFHRGIEEISWKS